MKPILEIRNLSKKYHIGKKGASYLNLRESIMNVFKRKTPKDTIWALNDLSMDIYPGDTIGIIGNNGAGKSTLLKILSKITPPTSGHAKARGRIASLLEIGTGFHPELTGIENIYLNGAILGMKRWEVQRQFDEIVDFSGVERFLDTPLKYYSSGMQLRLAFAVAAHLEPEILLIDEILAVGDQEFQKKCLGKMDKVSKSGKTVLFVSHNLGSIRQLCRRTIIIEGGKKRFDGITEMGIEQYQHAHKPQTQFSRDAETTKHKSIFIEQIKVLRNFFLFGEAISFSFQITSKRNSQILVSFTIRNFVNQSVGSKLFKRAIPVYPEESRMVRIEISNLNLAPGRYSLTVAISESIMANVVDVIRDAVSFEIISNDNDESTNMWISNWGNIVLKNSTLEILDTEHS